MDWRLWIAGSAARGAALVTLLTATSGALIAQSRPAARPPAETPSSQPVSRDEALWREICELARELSATTPFPNQVASALGRRRMLLGRARLYLTAYPGGPQRDEVVRLELQALFEIGTLSGGTYEPLRRQVQAYLRHAPSEPVLHEAAYWAICCRRLARVSATSQPSVAPGSRLDADLLEAYRDHVRQYPRSRYVPRMAAELFDAAAARGDDAEMQQVARQLRRDFPEHTVTALLTAQLRRRDAVGQPFALAFETADGERVDTARWRGRPVLIVVWDGLSEPARACARQVEAFRQQQAELRVVGVNLDESEQRMSAVCRELGLSWPQFNDGRGWANRFALEWGVREVPSVFVVDRQGRLVGSTGAEGWRELAISVLEN